MSQYKSVPDDAEWEPGERALIKRLVKPGDRVLELGTAIGAAAITAGVIVGAKNVLTIDGNIEMIQKARSNFAAEELSEIKTKLGVCVSRKNYKPGQLVEFFIALNFVDSRLRTDDMSDAFSCVQINTLCLEDEIAAHEATVLICDIEGGETALLTSADLAGIRLLILETHGTRSGSQEDINLMFEAIRKQNFCEVDRAYDSILAFGRQ